MLNLSSLNPQQRLAGETIHGPVLVLAGAGTGKTRVITYRIAHLIERGTSPENILAVTFTNKAAREMRGRVVKLIGNKVRSERGEVRSARSEVQSSGADGQPSTPDTRHTNPAPRPTVCTFHSLCVRILRQHIEKLGYKPNFVIYDETEQLSAVKKILAQISARGEKTDPAAILSLLSRFKNGGERAAMFAEESTRAMADHIRSRYESALRACNAVDFDDLILLTLRLFREHPAALEACRARYRQVMVDEYQDTNAAQFQLVQALTQEHRNLCVVGDDDQSIYGWRGAEIANLLEMEKHYAEVNLIRLEQNYRSTNTILGAANAIIKNNLRRRGKNLWSQKGEGEKIALHTFRDDDEEARSVVEQIEYARLAHRVPWGEQAILFRTNVQSRPLETALRQGGVRYHLIGGQSFFDRREVRDLVAYLKTFVNPDDDVSLLRIANVPARGLSDATMERLLAASHERKCSVFGVMKNPAVAVTFSPKTREAIERFVAFIERTRNALLPSGRSRREEALTSDPSKVSLPRDEALGAGLTLAPTLADWADRWLGEIGYFEELRWSEKTAEAAESRIRNLRDLTAMLDGTPVSEPARWELPESRGFGDPRSGRALERLESFLEEITLDTEREAQDEAPREAVTLI